MSKNWTDAELDTIQTEIARLETSARNDIAAYHSNGDAARAKRMGLASMPPDNLTSTAIANRWHGLVSRIHALPKQ